MCSAKRLTSVCVVKNHNIPEPIIDSAFDSVRAFFDLPLETKMEVRQQSCSRTTYRS
jgi:isopenicillin N synthase-like dioxygenase